MRYTRRIFFIGLWIIILPFLGFPPGWKTFFLFLTGLSLCFFAFAIHRKSIEATGKSTDTVVPSASQWPVFLADEKIQQTNEDSRTV